MTYVGSNGPDYAFAFGILTGVLAVSAIMLLCMYLNDLWRQLKAWWNNKRR